MPLTIKDPLTAKIVAFLERIGLPVGLAEIPESFLPGIAIQSGVLLIDEARLLYPGDLLHEAGHLALLPPAVRRAAHDDLGDDGGLEVAAIAWSYAASVHLGIDLSVLFHEGGYRGAAKSLILTFSLGCYPGVPQLERAGLTAANPPYPSMLKWLRDE